MNKIESFKFGPDEVEGTVYASSNRLKSLEFMPSEIKYDFIVYSNPLKELDSVSNIEGDIFCDPNLDKSKFRGYCQNIHDGSIEAEGLPVASALRESILSKDKLSIEETLEKLAIENYKINLDGTVDVDGNVHLHKYNLKEIPIQFGKVSGYFLIANNNLTSLNGCPYYVGEGFNCSYNKLKNLIGGPTEVGNDYVCYHNDLESLDGIALEIEGNLNIRSNKLNDIEIISNIEGVIFCDRWVEIDISRGHCMGIKKNLLFN